MSRQRIVVAGLIGVMAALTVAAVSSAYKAWLPRYRLGQIASDCEEHSCVNNDVLVRRFLECGEGVVPPLLDDMQANLLPSYTPWPQDLLRNFPDATKKEIISRLQSYREPLRNEDGGEVFLVGKFLQRRANLIYGLIYVADDWSYLENWISDAQRPERREWSAQLSVREMSNFVNSKLSRFGAPPLVNMARNLDWSVNPEFVERWKLHKTEVASAKEE